MLRSVVLTDGSVLTPRAPVLLQLHGDSHTRHSAQTLGFQVELLFSFNTFKIGHFCFWFLLFLTRNWPSSSSLFFAWDTALSSGYFADFPFVTGFLIFQVFGVCWASRTFECGVLIDFGKVSAVICVFAWFPLLGGPPVSFRTPVTGNRTLLCCLEAHSVLLMFSRHFSLYFVLLSFYSYVFKWPIVSSSVSNLQLFPPECVFL